MFFSKLCGNLTVNLNITHIGDDITVILTGGTEHIGAVALGQFDENTYRSFGSVLSASGHKEDEIALFGAKYFAKRTGKCTVFICGIHVPDISAEEIHTIDTCSRKLIQESADQYIQTISDKNSL